MLFRSDLSSNRRSFSGYPGGTQNSNGRGAANRRSQTGSDSGHRDRWTARRRSYRTDSWRSPANWSAVEGWWSLVFYRCTTVPGPLLKGPYSLPNFPRRHGFSRVAHAIRNVCWWQQSRAVSIVELNRTTKCWVSTGHQDQPTAVRGGRYWDLDVPCCRRSGACTLLPLKKSHTPHRLQGSD